MRVRDAPDYVYVTPNRLRTEPFDGNGVRASPCLAVHGDGLGVPDQEVDDRHSLHLGLDHEAQSPPTVLGGECGGQEVDVRTDLWSLGVVLYEMLFGATPFSGENTVEKLAAILYKEPEPQEKVPAELAKILDKALQKEPENRYQTAVEMMEDLQHLRQEFEFAEQLQIHATSSSGDEDKAWRLVHAASRAGARHLVYISVFGADRIPIAGTIDRVMFGYVAARLSA